MTKIVQFSHSSVMQRYALSKSVALCDRGRESEGEREGGSERELDYNENSLLLQKMYTGKVRCLTVTNNLNIRIFYGKYGTILKPKKLRTMHKIRNSVLCFLVSYEASKPCGCLALFIFNTLSSIRYVSLNAHLEPGYRGLGQGTEGEAMIRY